MTAAYRRENRLHWPEEDVFNNTECYRSSPHMDLQEGVDFCVSSILKVARYQASARWADFSGWWVLKHP